MAQAAWEKQTSAHGIEDKRAQLLNQGNERWKFLVGGLLLIGAIGYLIISGMLTGTRFFISVDEIVSDPQFIGQSVRVTGAVHGDTIIIDESNPENTTIRFTVANIAREYDNLADALHEAIENPNATQLAVYVEGQPKPELLQHEAQAIMTGTLGEDGIFYASELQFKCPSRFEEAGPVLGEEDHPGMQRLPEGSANAG